MEDKDFGLNIQSSEAAEKTDNISSEGTGTLLAENDQIEKDEFKNINATKEAEHIYSIISEAVPKKDGVRRNLGKRDFALWVLPILAINRIRRFNKNGLNIVKPYESENNLPYTIKGDETIYTNTKNIFEGKDSMRFFGFRFMAIWVFPMAITGTVMEFLFVGPLKGTNPFG